MKSISHTPLLRLFLTLAAVGFGFIAAKPKAPVKTIKVDLCVYGGVSAGVVGAVTGARYGLNTLLIEPQRHLGGMSTSGLGATDIGNKFAITGIARDVYRRIGMHYGKLEQWEFEPKVAEGVFTKLMKDANVPYLLKHRALNVKKKGTKITAIELEHIDKPGQVALVVQAAQFMDCSYEGDLMALAKVSYVVGREDNAEFKETLNGVQLQDKHQFVDGIDPYKVAGDSTSGLLWGISPEKVKPNGTGDQKVQAYNFRLCLSTNPNNQLPFTQPADYDPSMYALLGRVIAKSKYKDVKNFMIINPLPNDKTDCNHKGGFSLDMVGMNWNYPEANWAERKKIAKAHEDYIKGMLYFLANDLSLPDETRLSMRRYGWPKDEFKDNGGFPFQMYVREARRMRGEVVMTQHHCQAKEVVTDGVGLAAYQMDSHNCQRVVVNGMVKNEGNVEVDLGSKPYPISYKAIVPKKEECSNLYVPVCLSATHIAYGSIRMEPVFMVLAQSAAVAAKHTLKSAKAVQDANVSKIQAELARNPLANGDILEVLVDDSQKDLVSFDPEQFKQSEATRGKFGLSYLQADTTQGPVSATFHMTVPKSGKYKAFCFVTSLVKKAEHEVKASETATVEVKGGNTVASFQLNPRQYYHEWAPLGEVQLDKGKAMMILTTNGKGLMAADAMMLVPVKSATK